MRTAVTRATQEVSGAAVLARAARRAGRHRAGCAGRRGARRRGHDGEGHRPARGPHQRAARGRGAGWRAPTATTASGTTRRVSCRPSADVVPTGRTRYRPRGSHRVQAGSSPLASSPESRRRSRAASSTRRWRAGGLGGPSTWTRTNHRGEPISLLEGPAVAAGLVAGAAVGGGNAARCDGVRDGRRGAASVWSTTSPRTPPSAPRACGVTSVRSRAGRLTTGGLKVLGISGSALVAAAVRHPAHGRCVRAALVDVGLAAPSSPRPPT